MASLAGAAVIVVSVMITAVTLLPALLSLLGTKVFAGKDAVGTQTPSADRGRRFHSYAAFVESGVGPVTIVALVVMAILAILPRHCGKGSPMPDLTRKAIPSESRTT